MLNTAFAAALAGLVAVAPARPAPVHAQAAPAPITWKVDGAHSDLQFKIRHLISKVTGTVRDWTGTIVVDPASLSGGTVEFTANVATIDTRNERRDGHLKSAEFFEVEKFPTISFKSTKVVAKGNAMKITGDLTIKGVTKSITLDAEYLGATGAPEAGKQKVGFHASATINRLDFGVSWNRAIEGGGLTLGDEVELDFNIEAVRT